MVKISVSLVCEVAGKPFRTRVGNKKYKHKREKETKMQWQ